MSALTVVLLRLLNIDFQPTGPEIERKLLRAYVKINK